MLLKNGLTSARVLSFVFLRRQDLQSGEHG